MTSHGLEIVDIREISVLRHLTEQEETEVRAVHVYGSGRSTFEGVSALYITKNDEVYLAGFDSLVRKSCVPKVTDECRGILEKSIKVEGLSGMSLQKILVADEFGAALTSDNELVLWGCDVGAKLPAGLSRLVLEEHYDGACCPKCSRPLTQYTKYGALCSYCSICYYHNKVSTIPHPTGWKGRSRTVIGYAATGTAPQSTNLFCSKCGVYKQRSTTFKVSNFILLYCTSCSLLIDGDSSVIIPPQTNTAPHKVTFPSSAQIRDIAAGSNFLLIQTSTQLIVWGDLGVNRYNHALRIPDNVTFTMVACGSTHVAVISDKGDLYTCGVGDKGQLGYTWSSGDDHLTLRKVSFNAAVADVVCGQNSTACLLHNGAYSIYGGYSKVVSGGTWSLNLFESSLLCVPLAASLKHVKIIESSLKHYSNPNNSRSVLLTGDLSDVFLHLHGLKSEPQEYSGRQTELNCQEVSKEDAGSQTDSVLSKEDAGSQTDSVLSESSSLARSDGENSMRHFSNSANLYGQLLFSDLTLKLADGDFPAHRYVLFTASAYFRQALADSESPEVLDMSSYNATAYRGLLKYFYCVPLGDMTCEDMFDLYLLATSYKEDWIATDLISKLKSSICPSNVLSLFDKAKAANASELLNECQNFMSDPAFQQSLWDRASKDVNMVAEILRLTMSS